MKIGNAADKPVGVAPTTLPTEAAKTAALPGGAGAPAAIGLPDASAKVEFSSTASTLMSTGASAEFDADKVGRIAQAIASAHMPVETPALYGDGHASERIAAVLAGVPGR